MTELSERTPAGRWSEAEDLAGAAVFCHPRPAITCPVMFWWLTAVGWQDNFR